MKTTLRSLLVLTFGLFSVIAIAQWQQTSLNNKTITQLANLGDTIFAATVNDGVYVTTDDGTTWTKKANGLTNLAVYSIAEHNGKIYAGTSDGVFVSSDGAENWTSISNGLTGVYTVNKFAFIGNDIFIGTLNNVYKTSDGGANWNYSGSGIPSLSNNIKHIATNGTKLYAGSYNNAGVYVSSDTGKTWTATGLSTYPIRAMGVNGNHWYAASSDSIYHSTNDGATWQSTVSGISILHKWSLSFLFSNNYTVVGTRGGGVYVSADNGTNWTSISNGFTMGTYVNTLAINSNYIFAGTDYQQGVWRRPAVDITISVNKQLALEDVSVFPNPANEKLFVSIQSNLQNANASLVIYNVTGELVYQGILANNKAAIDISSFGKGMYFVQIQSGNQTHSGKFVVE